MELTHLFQIALRITDLTYRELAEKAGLNPAIISRIANGHIRPRYKDPRIIQLGQLLGLREDRIFVEIMPKS
jgi:predicted transcriptional regulator